MSVTEKWTIAILIYVIGFPAGMFLILLPFAWMAQEHDRAMRRIYGKAWDEYQQRKYGKAK